MTTIFELLFVPLFIGLIIYIAGPLSVVPVAVLMIFTLVSYIQGKTLRRAAEERDEIDDRRYNFLIESLEGITVSNPSASKTSLRAATRR